MKMRMGVTHIAGEKNERKIWLVGTGGEIHSVVGFIELCT